MTRSTPTRSRPASCPSPGRGLRLVLTDAPSDDPDVVDPSLRVQDVDLQVVVNGLWAAGAEAIAVNGQRLTAMTAIRSAGDAVLVDLVALSSPYTVEAVGDAVDMQTELARASAGQHLATLRTNCGHRRPADVAEQARAARHGSGHDVLGPGARVESVVPGAVRRSAVEGAPDEAGVAGSAGPTGRDGT